MRILKYRVHPRSCRISALKTTVKRWFFLFGLVWGFAKSPCEISLRWKKKGGNTTRCRSLSRSMCIQWHPTTPRRFFPRQVKGGGLTNPNDTIVLMSSWGKGPPNRFPIWLIWPSSVTSSHHVDQLFHRPIIFPSPSWSLILCPNHVNLRFFLIWSFLRLDLPMSFHWSPVKVWGRQKPRRSFGNLRLG